MSATGNVVAHHLSMTAAAASVNIAKSTMSDVIQNGHECANHFWRYVDGNEGGEGVEVPRRTPTKHDVVISDDKHSSAKDVHCPSCGKIHPRQWGNYCNTCQQCFHHKSLCSHLKEGVERPDRSEGVGAAGGSGRRGEHGRRSGACGRDADSFGSFITPKDQGWGELLDSKLVMPGDTICPPGRGENKDRRALVQDDGLLLEEDAGKPWIDPVAFCVSNNNWKESATFLKDRNRIGHCTRVRGDDEEKKLSELKIEARKRNSLGGDEGPPSSTVPNNLKPAIGARVQVRFDVDKKIKWFKAQLIELNKTTREWKIKLDVCEDATESQRECDGCCECVHQLESGTRDW